MSAPVWLQHYHPATPRSLEYGPDTLVDHFHHTVNTWGDRPAYWWQGHSHTWARLNAQVRATAAALHSAGVRPGDRVALALPNCPEHLIAFHAILRTGATAVQHNPQFTARELRAMCADHKARLAIVAGPTVPAFAEAASDAPLETIIVVGGAPERNHGGIAMLAWEDFTGADVPAHAPRTEDTALILYTSGTTGTPKGVCLTHANLVANARQTQAFLPQLADGQERTLAALPLFHSYGFVFNVALATLIGAETVLVPAPTMPALIDAVLHTTPTLFPAVPVLYDRLLDAAAEAGVSLRGIKLGISGAAPLPVQLAARWEAATGGLLLEGYGLTEAAPILTINPPTDERRPGFIGLAVPDTQLRVADPADPARTLPIGETGELLARGPQVFGGYLDRPDATAESFQDGWLRTGDMAVMDQEGFVRLVGRLKEIIITGGFNVYPAEVEEVLMTHPDVARAVVVGVDREDGSEDPVACVVLAEGADLDEEGLKDFARRYLARYKVPRAFYAFDELAADGLGKIRRREVKEALLARLCQVG